MIVIQGKKHVSLQRDPLPPLELSHRILPTGETAVEIGGELDLATAEEVFRYVQKIINRHRGPVVVSLAGARFRGARCPDPHGNCRPRAGRSRRRPP